MSGYLHYGGFKWLKNFDGFNANSVSEKNSVGYILEVDFRYPDELHALHDDYSLAPEKLATPYDMLSDYCKITTNQYAKKVGDVKILIPILDNKTN